MKDKQRLKKISDYFDILKKIEAQQSKLKEIESKTLEKEQVLCELNEKIDKKQKILESLKNEIIELKDFINSNFEKELGKYDYKVDIRDCYIIDILGKKYIVLKKSSIYKSDVYSGIAGHYNTEVFEYYDVLNREYNSEKDLHEYRMINKYIYCHFDIVNAGPINFKGQKPSYERHILEVCPELVVFADNNVPNTYLKKIYYEINELGNKKLIKKIHE